MKTSPADQAFSKCIRAAADYKCQKCGKQYDKSSTGLHCSHNFSRRHRTIRWCKDNAMSICFSCHQWIGGEPLDSGKWIESVLGSGVVEMLREKMNSKFKISKSEEKEIAKHYREQLKIINQKRIDGAQGYIDFESYQ